MPNTLKRNIEITRDGFAKNLEICWTHAKNVIHTSAVNAALHRSDPCTQQQYLKQFDEAHAVVAWLESVKKVVHECPTLTEHPGEIPEPPHKPPVEIEQ